MPVLNEHTQANTPPRAIVQADAPTTEKVQIASDASIERSRRQLSEASVLVVCPHLV